MDNAILKDLGPFKQNFSDNSLPCFLSFELEQVTQTITVGQRIEIAPTVIDSSISSSDFVQVV